VSRQSRLFHGSSARAVRHRSGRCRTGLALLSLTGLLVAAGCGRKADPRPPEFVIPRSPEPVVVENVPDGIKLTWHRPRTYVDGTRLDDLGSFRVLRACDAETEFRLIAQIPITDRDRFRKIPSFLLVDHDVSLGSTCRYRVVAATLDDYTSAPAESWYLTRVFVAPTPSPTAGRRSARPTPDRSPAPTP
jgi:hypothetical protein